MTPGPCCGRIALPLVDPPGVRSSCGNLLSHRPYACQYNFRPPGRRAGACIIGERSNRLRGGIYGGAEQRHGQERRGGGVILIGIGMLALTRWWWPGIMLVIGCSLAAE